MNILRKLIFLLFTLVCFISNANKTENVTGRITGLVYDAKTKTPIEFASVSIYKTSDSLLVSGAITNISGKYEISNLPYGDYYIIVQFLGYEKFKVESIELSQKNKEIETIYLNENIKQLEAVTIIGEQKLIEQKIDKKVINVSQDINSTGGTATDVLINNALVQTNSNGDVLLRNSSSFVVLVDGKPSPFEGTEALNQIQASNIEKIELITNPSAKYDAEGISGIINIITKKQIFKGISGQVNTSYSTNNSCSGDFIFNYKNKKINTFIGADYKKQVTTVVFDIDRTYTSGDSLFSREEYIKQIITRPNPNAKFGFEFQINTNTNISFTNTSGTGSNLDKTKSVHIKQWSNFDETPIYLANKEDGNTKAFFSTPTLSFLHNFIDNGTKLSANISYTYAKGDYSFLSKEFNADEFYQSIDNTPLLLNSSNSYIRNFIEAKTDFTWVANDKTTVESGAEISDNKRDVVLDFTNFDYSANDWFTNTLYTNNFVFNQKIYAAYLLLSGQLATFEYQIGLRGEYTDRILEQKLKNENYIYQQLHFFPSFSILKPVGERVQLQFSYSRRISRPIDFHLNPFPSTVSSSFINIGNPELEPDFPNSFEFNITTDLKLFVLNINNFLNYTEKATTQVLSINEQGTQILTFENMNFNKFIGSEISTTIKSFKTLNLSPGINVYFMESLGKISQYDAHFKTTTYDLSLNTSLKITKSTKFQSIIKYSGKGVTQQGYMKSNYFLTASIKQDLMKERFSIVIQGRNLLKSNQLKFNEYGYNFNTKLHYQLETNIVSFTLSYKFNNFKKNAMMQSKIIDNEI